MLKGMLQKTVYYRAWQIAQKNEANAFHAFMSSIFSFITMLKRPQFAIERNSVRLTQLDHAASLIGMILASFAKSLNAPDANRENEKSEKGNQVGIVASDNMLDFA